jgi:hypothetical protein
VGPVIVDGICVGDTLLTPLDEGCEIVRFPEVHDDQHKKQMVRVVSPPIPGVFQPTFHHDCACNHVRSAIGRVLGVVPKPSMPGIARLQEVARVVGSWVPVCPPQGIWDMPAKYSGAKRLRYEQAVDRYLRFGVRAFDAHCTMFVKSERFDGHAKVNPDPRPITFRSSVFCVALAQYLQPIEHYIYSMSGFSCGVPPSRNIAKGLNQSQRAELLRSKMQHFKAPVVVSLDASRFDKHVDYELLKIEHSVYLYHNYLFEFAWLLHQQLESVVSSKYGLKYRVRGRRMSGDMNTALGNCLIMLIMLFAFAKHLQLPIWDCLDDGDDCLLIIEQEALDSVLGCVVEHFLDYGMEMKVESVADSLHKVVFCQSSVVEFADARYKFVRDYRAVISKSLCGIRHWQDANYRLKVLRAIGLCELVLNLGVPVLQEFALAILRNVGRPVKLDLASDGLRARVIRELRSIGCSIENVKPQPIKEVARLSFAVAFGLPVDEQLYLENQLSSWEFDVTSAKFWGAEWDVSRWLPAQSYLEVCPHWQNAKTEA